MSLQSPSNEWLKVELLIEFGQWLCVKDFPLQDSVDQLEWAIDIMLNMQVEADARKEEGRVQWILIHLNRSFKFKILEMF